MKRSAGIAMVACLVGVSMASAATYGTVTVKLDSVSPGLTMQTMAAPYDTSWYSGPTGQFNLTLTNPSAGVPALYGQPGFCLEVETTSIGSTVAGYSVADLSDAPVSSGPADTSQGPMSTAKADAIRELWARHISEVNSNVTAAAFQLCVWELVYEDLYVASPPGWDVTTGKFTANNVTGDPASAVSQANTWLASIDGTGPMTTLYALTKEF